MSSTFGDLGLRLMDLRTLLQTWTDIGHSDLLSAALLGVVIAQVLATCGALAAARRLAARPLSE